MKQPIEIPVSRIREVLSYDPLTGIFLWKVKTGDKVVVGSRAGNATGHGKARISVDTVLYAAHRLAWVIMTGEQPPDVIDHANGDPLDNRWANLRAADYSLNSANRASQSNSQTSVKGVCYVPYLSRKKPWLAQLTCKGVPRLRKCFATQEEAKAAYDEAARRWFGDFARI